VSSLEPRSPKRVSRKDREARAFRLVAAGSVFGAIAVIGFVLAVLGIVGFGIPLLSGIVAVICLVLFRRSVGL
jgi:hypothetical protein